MLPRSRLSLVLGASAVSLAGAARATPLDDYRRGTGVHLANAAIRVEGNDYYIRDFYAPKAADSLDVVVPLRDVGVPADGSVRLRGAADGGLLVWTFDESFSPWIDLGEGNFVKRVAGAFVTSVRPSAGTASLACAGGACDYSVVLQNEPGSYATVWGRSQDTVFGWFADDWQITSHDLQFSAYAGLPRPPLAALEVEAPREGRFCASDRDRAYAARVRLSSVAPYGGVWVNVGSDHPTALRTRRVRVEAGRDSASFTLYFPGGFAGDAHVGAASGGVSLSRSLRLEPCLPTLDERYRVDESFNDRYGVCDACMEAVRLNESGGALVRSKGEWFVDAPDVGPFPLDKIVGEGPVKDAYLNAFGELAGFVQALSGEVVGFRVRGWPDAPKVELLPGFRPGAFDDLGVLFGLCDGKQKVEGPCFHDGAWPSPLPVAGALGAPLTTLLGAAVGERKTSEGVRAYRLVDDKAKELEGFGGETRVAAIDQGGDAVGWSLTPQKVRQAALFRAGAGKAEPLGGLDGFLHTEAVGVSERGVIVGTAEAKGGARRAFVAVAGKGMAALDGRVEPPKGVKLELREALSISRDGTIVARGVRDGAHGTFVLRPEK